MASAQGYNFCCFLRGSGEEHPRAPAAFPAAEGAPPPSACHAANKCLPRVMQQSLSFPCDKPRCAVFWQRLCLQPEEPLLMVSQGSLGRVARRALRST